MGRINAVLDEEVDYGFEGGGEYKTNETDSANGFREADSKWKFPKHRYSASFTNIKEDARDYFIEVFHACRGKRHSFLFKDWNDFVAEDEPLNVESGTANKVQLYKTYSFGQAYTIRPIYAVKEGTEVYDENGDPVPGTLNLLTGEFTPVSEWGDGPYTWSGEFYVWVHFADDYNGMTIASWQAHDAGVDLIEDPIKITATNVPASWEE